MILLKDFIPLLWSLSGKIIAKFGYNSSHEITQTLAFIFVGSLISTVLDLPWSIYMNFWIEEKHGFNKYTGKFYFKVRVKHDTDLMTKKNSFWVDNDMTTKWRQHWSKMENDMENTTESYQHWTWDLMIMKGTKWQG